jgi:hypothetical protein
MNQLQIANVKFQIERPLNLQSEILNLKSEMGSVGFHHIGFDDAANMAPANLYPHFV